MTEPKLFALDFDGVLCDSVLETAASGWKAALSIWPDMPKTEAPNALLEQFRQVRPMIETGYESIFGMRLLFTGESIESIRFGYTEKTEALIRQTGSTVDGLKKLFEDTRDHWIAADLAGWVAMNPLYSGVADKLKVLDDNHHWIVTTTKQERFVNYILQANGIELPGDRLFGLDRKLNKSQILKMLLQTHPEHSLNFVEDRFLTLVNIAKDPELASVKLILANWGYNTEEDRLQAAQQGFSGISLAEFLAF